MESLASKSSYVTREEHEALRRELEQHAQMLLQLKGQKSTFQSTPSHCHDAACQPIKDQNSNGKVIKIAAMILVCSAALYKDNKSFLIGSSIAVGSHFLGLKTSQKLAETGSLRGCNGIISVIFGLQMQSEIESIFEITVLCSHILGHDHHGMAGHLLEKAYPGYIGLFAGFKMMHALSKA